MLAEFLDTLKQNPNKWAEYPKHLTSGTNAYIWRKKYAEFQFVPKKVVDENNNGYAELYWYTANNTPQPSWGIFSDLYLDLDGMWLENGQYDEANNYVQSQWRWRMDGITEFPNRITFNQSVGYAIPDLIDKTGEKIVLWDETGSEYNYAIGVEDSAIWFGVDQANAVFIISIGVFWIAFFAALGAVG